MATDTPTDSSSVHFAVACETDSDTAWPYKCEPGDHADESYWFEADAPAEAWDRFEQAGKVLEAARAALVEIAGVDEEQLALKVACEEWKGTVREPVPYVRIQLALGGGRHMYLEYLEGAGIETVEEAEARIAEFPDTFHVVVGGRARLFDRSALVVDAGTWPGWSDGRCQRCGHDRGDHVLAGAEG